MKENNIDRIRQMESHLDRASAAVMNLSAALDEYEAVRPALQELAAYYGSPAWREDLADDEAGRLPADLKRGVLSEDAVWNLLTDDKELRQRLQTLVHHDD